MSKPIILKESNAKKKKYHCDKLQSSLNKIGPRFEYLYKKLTDYSKGFEGEDITAFKLRFLPEGYIIIHDLFLKIDDIQAQIDHLVISKKGFFLLESKYWSSDIIIDKDKNWHIVKEDGSIIGVENPCLQSQQHYEVIRRHLRVFEQSYQLNSMDIPSFNIAVLASVSSKIDSVHNLIDLKSNDFTTKVDGICNTIKDISKNNDDVLSFDDALAIGNYLVSQSQEAMTVYRRLNMTDSDLFQPIKFSDGTTVSTPKELISSIDSHWNECSELFVNGSLKFWFDSMGNQAGSDLVSKILASTRNKNIALEQFVSHNPWLPLPKPKLIVTPNTLTIKKANFGEQYNLLLEINNNSRGFLYGDLEVKDPVNPSRVFTFDERSRNINIPINTSLVHEKSKSLNGEIQFNSNGGTAKVPYHLYFKFPLLSFLKVIGFYGALTSASFLGILGLQQIFMWSPSFMTLTMIVLFFFSSRFILSHYRVRKHKNTISVTTAFVITSLIPYTTFIYYPLSFGSYNLSNGRLDNFYPLLPIALFGFLVGVALIGIPKWFNRSNEKYFRLLSKGIGISLILVLFGFAITSDFTKMYFDKEVLSIPRETYATTNTTEQENIVKHTFNLIALQAYKEDVGQEIYFMNVEDMTRFNRKRQIT